MGGRFLTACGGLQIRGLLHVVQDGVVPEVTGSGLEEPGREWPLGGGGRHLGGAGVVDLDVLVGVGAGVAENPGVHRHGASPLPIASGKGKGGN